MNKLDLGTGPFTILSVSHTVRDLELERDSQDLLSVICAIIKLYALTRATTTTATWMSVKKT